MRYYYLRRLASSAFWRKFVAGALDIPASARHLRSTATAVARLGQSEDAPFLKHMQAGLMGYRGPMLLLLSDNDLTAREFEQWISVHRVRRKVLEKRDVRVARIPDADHTFSQSVHCREAERAIVDWIGSIESR
jgi:hypothetical protein